MVATLWAGHRSNASPKPERCVFWRSLLGRSRSREGKISYYELPDRVACLPQAVHDPVRIVHCRSSPSVGACRQVCL